ncbi:MAG: spore coat associated protein CotJA [Clostridia bacterium]|nr:spore coat associated protein CotJA [Clostridia bacterium]MBR3955310.1 spore coat associated protein CotJA [Clostridia bacterium]
MKEHSSARKDRNDCIDSFSMLSALPEDAAVTMAYVPFQLDNKVYEAETALCRGTLFPVLDKPFLRAGCK